MQTWLESFGCQILKKKCLRHFVLLSAVQSFLRLHTIIKLYFNACFIIIYYLYQVLYIFIEFPYIDILILSKQFPTSFMETDLLFMNKNMKRKKVVFSKTTCTRSFGNSLAGLMQFLLHTKGRLLVLLTTHSLYFSWAFLDKIPTVSLWATWCAFSITWYSRHRFSINGKNVDIQTVKSVRS